MPHGRSTAFLALPAAHPGGRLLPCVHRQGGSAQFPGHPASVFRVLSRPAPGLALCWDLCRRGAFWHLRREPPPVQPADPAGHGGRGGSDSHQGGIPLCPQHGGRPANYPPPKAGGCGGVLPQRQHLHPGQRRGVSPHHHGQRGAGGIPQDLGAHPLGPAPGHAPGGGVRQRLHLRLSPAGRGPHPSAWSGPGDPPGVPRLPPGGQGDPRHRPGTHRGGGAASPPAPGPLVPGHGAAAAPQREIYRRSAPEKIPHHRLSHPPQDPQRPAGGAILAAGPPPGHCEPPGL